MRFASTWAGLIAGWYPNDPFKHVEAIRQYYEVKWNIMQQVRAGRIMEIGVRAGYSAYVMLSASPRARYLGLDNGLCDAEGRADYLAHARKLLSPFDARLWLVDSGTLRSFPAGPDGDLWDLVHVDGHHSYEGCLHDILLASEVSRHILVDDYDTGPGIQRAVEEFRLGAGHGKWSAQHFPDGNVAGNMLLEKVGG